MHGRDKEESWLLEASVALLVVDVFLGIGDIRKRGGLLGW